jgi:hypothetical protein
MTKRPRGSSGANCVTRSLADQRRERLADELRANLRKRKALARKRQAGADHGPEVEAETPDCARDRLRHARATE